VSSVQLAARDATDAAIAKLGTPVVRVNELDERFAACLGAHMDAGLELEIGFGDVEHLGGVPARLLGNSRSVGDDRICREGKCQNSGRERDSLIRPKISLIARFNSPARLQKIPC
jgi:hypothetical protein